VAIKVKRMSMNMPIYADNSAGERYIIGNIKSGE
jgi:hypothetical protein